LWREKPHPAQHTARYAPIDAFRGQGTVAHQERGWEAWGLKVLGDIHTHAPTEVDHGWGEHAGDTYRQALATELGMRPLVAHCHFGLGKLYRQTNKREQAREHLTTASTMYREMDMQFWLKKAEVEIRGLG
jgi:hypothetical protein